MNTSPTPQLACTYILRQSLRRSSGFSLVELLIVLAVVALLLTFAVPSLSGMLQSSRLTAASNALLASMHLARGEAIKRNSRVVLCKSENGLTCSSTGGWEQGWIVFHDLNNNGDRDSGETLIERIPPLPSTVTLTGNSTVAKYVSFMATGATKLIGGGFQAGTLTVCNVPSSAGEARQVVINAVGRPRVQRVAAASACA